MAVSPTTTTPVPATIEPLSLSLSVGEESIFVEHDSDLSVNVRAGTHNGAPLRYDAQGGTVLVLLDVDDDHTQVRVQPSLKPGSRDMLDVLREASTVIDWTIEALERVSKA